MTDTKAQRESIVSSIITYANATQGADFVKTDPDLRANVANKVDEIALSLETDTTSWTFVKDRMFYDVYLAMREEEGTATELDRIRPGLREANFSDSASFFEHAVRQRAATIRNPEETKTCTKCGKEKLKSKFKKGGGSVCNACQSKQYRERKLEAMK